jgi:hypothetical protein
MGADLDAINITDRKQSAIALAARRPDRHNGRFAPAATTLSPLIAPDWNRRSICQSETSIRETAQAFGEQLAELVQMAWRTWEVMPTGVC